MWLQRDAFKHGLPPSDGICWLLAVGVGAGGVIVVLDDVGIWLVIAHYVLSLFNVCNLANLLCKDLRCPQRYDSVIYCIYHVALFTLYSMLYCLIHNIELRILYVLATMRRLRCLPLPDTDCNFNLQ